MSDNLPPINDHEFMKLVRKLVDATPSTPMTRIAFDLGVDVDDLCAWIMAYKEPRRKPYLNRDSAPPAYTAPSRVPMSTRGDAQRLANWRRAQAGAAAARKSIAAPKRSVRNMAEAAE